jgi:hypothetical protein
MQIVKVFNRLIEIRLELSEHAFGVIKAYNESNGE